MLTCRRCLRVSNADWGDRCRGEDAQGTANMRARWLRFKKTKSNRTHLLQAWNLTVEEVDVRLGVQGNVAAASKRAKTCHLPSVKTQEGNKLPGQASNPGPSSLAVWCLNTGSPCCAWNALRDAAKDGVDILAIQEQLMGPDELTAFHRKARDHGFAAYTQAGNVGRGRWSEERQWADAALLVSTRVKSRAHAYISHAGGQAVLVWAAGLLLCSCYVAQNEHADEFLAELTAHIGAAGPATRWAVMGDFNLEPHENPLVAALQRCHGGVLQVCSPDGVALPTRWRGTRSIDYLVGHCACTVSRLQFGMSKYNDHKLLVGSLSASAGAEVVNWMLVLLLVLTPSRLGGPKKLGHRPLVMSGTNVTPWLNQVLPPRKAVMSGGNLLLTSWNLRLGTLTCLPVLLRAVAVVVVLDVASHKPPA